MTTLRVLSPTGRFPLGLFVWLPVQRCQKTRVACAWPIPVRPAHSPQLLSDLQALYEELRCNYLESWAELTRSPVLVRFHHWTWHEDKTQLHESNPVINERYRDVTPIDKFPDGPVAFKSQSAVEVPLTLLALRAAARFVGSTDGEAAVTPTYRQLTLSNVTADKGIHRS